MMHQANVPIRIHYKVWKEAFKTATLLDGLTAITLDGVTATRYVHWNGHNPQFADNLRTWGEAGTVTTKTSTTPRVHDRGEQCMFVGYAINHSGDTYRMWNLSTNRVHETRDITWLKRMYFTQPILTGELHIVPEIEQAPTPTIQVGKGKELETEQQTETLNVETVEENEEEDEKEEVPEVETTTTTRSGREVKTPSRLIEMNAIAHDYEIKFSDAEIHYYDTIKQYPEGEFACVGAGLGGGFLNTHE
jgi:hypothetical protein